MKYVLQIKESIFPRLKANQYYYLGDIDKTILYGSVPLFERFLKSGSEFIGFVPFDELTPIEQANILSKVEKSKNHPEFLQYQLLRVVESLKQPNAEEQPPLSSPTQKINQSQKPSDDIKEYKHITYEIATQVLEMLSDGKTQTDIANELKFAEKQFRLVPELINIKKWVKECKDKRRLHLLNLHQYGMINDQELEDEINDCNYAENMNGKYHY